MKTRMMFLAICAGLLLTLGVACAPTALADESAPQLWVFPEGCGGQPTPCFTTIQEALDAAEDGATIHVAEGNYQELLTVSTNVTLTVDQPTNGEAYATVRPPESGGEPVAGALLTVPSGKIVAVDYFIFRDGVNTYNYRAGGINNDGNLTLRDSSVLDCSGNTGGGISNQSGSLTLVDCTVAGNESVEVGGGINICGSTFYLEHSQVSSNIAGKSGGGIQIFNSVSTILDSTIEGNSSATRGGGIQYLYIRPGNGTINDSAVTSNTAPLATDVFIYAGYDGGYVGYCNVDVGEVEGPFVEECAPPENRPPQFTSTPVLTATVGETYVYTATAEDLDEDQLVFFTPAKPDWATFEPLGDGTAVLSGIPTAAGEFTTTLVVLDSGASDYQVFVISVEEPPPPVTVIALDDPFTRIDEDTSIWIDVLANDYSKPENQDLQILSIGTPSQGGVAEVQTSTISYTPALNFNGVETFTYQAGCAGCEPGTALVTVTVNPVNDNPVAVDDSATTKEGESVVVRVLDNDFDVDGDELTVTDISVPFTGTLSFNGEVGTTGVVTYTAPLSCPRGTVVSFTYEIKDTQNFTATAKVEVTINPYAVYLPLVVRN
jgi:hypothetical protein